MRLDPKHIVVPVAVALVALLLLALDISAAPSCAKADSQLNHGFVRQAGAAFTAILTKHPDSKCAHDGMDAVIASECVEGDDAARAYLLSNALKTYQAILLGSTQAILCSGWIRAVIAQM